MTAWADGVEQQLSTAVSGRLLVAALAEGDRADAAERNSVRSDYLADLEHRLLDSLDEVRTREIITSVALLEPGSSSVLDLDPIGAPTYNWPEKTSVIDGCLVVPLSTGGRIDGAITFMGGRPSKRFLDADVEFAERVTVACGRALRNARLFGAANERRIAAESANRAKAELLGRVSHEIRTPLSAIGGYAELIEMGIRGPVTAQQIDDLQRIQKSQRHVLGLTNEVLTYAKLETGAVHYDCHDVSARDTLLAAESLVRPQARKKGLALTLDEGPANLLVWADVEKLRQILVNLLSNAVKFTNRGGRVHMSCTADDTTVRFAIHDTGIGVSADQLESIFGAFVQIRTDLTRTEEGAGLGLAISREFARGMGGELTIESTLGEGSTFTLSLPARAAAVLTARPSAKSASGMSALDGHLRSLSNDECEQLVDRTVAALLRRRGSELRLPFDEH